MLLGLLISALAWLFLSKPKVASESADGLDDGGELVSLLGGPRSVEAWSRGQSLGVIQVAPIGEGHYLRADAAQAFLGMLSRSARDGVSLIVNSSFRSMEKQTNL